MILGLQPKLILHHSYYPIDQFISVHASNLLSQLPLNLSLGAMYLQLLTLSLSLIPLNLKLLSLGLKLLCIITVGILIPRMWQKFICAGIKNQVISLRVVDLSIMSSISLQPTIEIIWINILDDPLY